MAKKGYSIGAGEERGESFSVLRETRLINKGLSRNAIFRKRKRKYPAYTSNYFNLSFAK